MKPARKVEVTPIGGRDYAVLVDGVHWCFAKCEPRGMHGATYTLHYHAQSEAIKEKGSAVVVWSDKHWLSSQGFYGRPDMARREAIHAGKYKTIPERIAEEAARLIKKKLILSPEKLKQLAEISRATQQQRIERAEAGDRKRLEIKADEVVTKVCVMGRGKFTLDENIRTQTKALIVEAMEWARSNT